MSDILIQKVKVILNEGHCYDDIKVKVRNIVLYLRMNDTDLGHQSNDLTKALEYLQHNDIHVKANNIMSAGNSQLRTYCNHVRKFELDKICDEDDDITRQIKLLNDKLCIVEKIKDEKFGSSAIIKLIKSAIADVRIDLINIENGIVDI